MPIITIVFQLNVAGNRPVERRIRGEVNERKTVEICCTEKEKGFIRKTLFLRFVISDSIRTTEAFDKFPSSARLPKFCTEGR
jgi:hypothetical protein